MEGATGGSIPLRFTNFMIPDDVRLMICADAVRQEAREMLRREQQAAEDDEQAAEDDEQAAAILLPTAQESPGDYPGQPKQNTMILNAKKDTGGNFKPHPATDEPILAVCCDLTPLEKRQTQWGEKSQFRLAFETSEKREDGSPYAVWSDSFTPHLNEKSNFRKFLKQMFGRDVVETDADAAGNIDFEKLCIGAQVKLIVVHRESNGETYANIGTIFPNKSGETLALSGKFVRKKDRDPSTQQQKASAPPQTTGQQAVPPAQQSAPKQHWEDVLIHVGNNKGKTVGQLEREDPAAIDALAERWMPTASLTNPQDEALSAALTAAIAARQPF